MIEIFTDGSVSPNPGPGGYAAVIKSNPVRVIGGYALSTTSSRMELRSVIEALKYLQDKTQTVIVYSDSEWVVRTAIGEYRRRKNLEMWSEFDLLRARFSDVVFFHKYGHRGDPDNELAHEWANWFRENRCERRVITL